jgi:predicted phosphoribosyltransferase
MIAESAVATGRYIYSFVNAEDAGNILSERFTGLNDAPVDVVTVGNLGVVVSPIAETKIRPQRKLLAAHQHVVTEIAKRWNALPVAFGLIADDTQSVESVLSRNSDLLLTQLNRIQGQVEMFLSIQWTAPNVFQYFIDRYPELARSRDYVASGEASRVEQIELGRQFEQALRSEREAHTESVLNILAPVCTETDLQALRSEAEIVRMACLIGRDKEQEFTEAVYRAASQFDDAFQFSFNGPWPPYSFVKLALSMEDS